MQIDIHSPSGSGQFGASVTVLSNGNFVVRSPYWDNGAAEKAGAAIVQSHNFNQQP